MGGGGWGGIVICKTGAIKSNYTALNLLTPVEARKRGAGKIGPTGRKIGKQEKFGWKRLNRKDIFIQKEQKRLPQT